MNTADSLIEFRNITQRFETDEGEITACAGIDLQVREGEFLALVGPSGCGKSTLLNMAAGLLAPTSGEALYRGQPVPFPNTAVGYLTQRDTLLPWRTVLANVCLPLEIRGVPLNERVDRSRALLSLVGLAGFENSYPAQLSGGMRRRASLARTLIYEPETILLDEPFGALDSQLRLVMNDLLVKTWTHTKSTIVFVTHDLGEALTVADRVAVFSSRPGHINVVQTVDLPRPRDVFRVRFEPRYVELHDELWAHLEDSVREQMVVPS